LNILALDPANKCGWAFSVGIHGGPPRYGVLNLTDRDRDRTMALHEWISDVHEESGIDLIAVEDSCMGSNNYQTAARHSELRGIIRLAAAEVGARLITVHPTTLKKFATGSGRAKKPQMIRACKTLLGIETDDDNIADALFILEWARQNPNPPPPKRKRRGKRKGDPQGRLF
jgi:Holliday junction resolvasome RuvABC endonuclease subunit